MVIECHERFNMAEGKSSDRERESKSIWERHIGQRAENHRYVIISFKKNDDIATYKKNNVWGISKLQSNLLMKIYEVRGFITT